jgi:hypothetical protein
MILNFLRVLALLLTAVTMAAGFAHLLEMPNKMQLSREDYLTVQQIYRGWALLGIPLIGALLTSLILTAAARGNPKLFTLTLVAVLCLALSLVVFFTFTEPANRATEYWTMLPDNWEEQRRQWEYSHAVNAGLYFLALTALALSLLAARDSGAGGPAGRTTY